MINPQGPGWLLFFQDDFVEPIPKPKIPGTGGGRYDVGYTKGRDDALLETRRKRILAEDDDIVGVIIAIVTKGLI